MKMDNSGVGSLEDQAHKRQERLKSMKRKHTDKTDDNDSNKLEMKLPKPKFRSYRPQDKTLTDMKLEQPTISEVKDEVKDLLDLAKKEVVIDQLDIATLAPRQPDWDLKRDVAKKLQKLERRTQKAMAELIRDRLKERQDLADIANAPEETYAT